MGIQHLRRFFNPRSVAVVGASESEGSVGRTLMQNLLQGEFSGGVHPVNPKHREVMGKACAASVTDLDTGVDLAVIATPMAVVPQIVSECAESGIRAAIVISAGGPEVGGEGGRIETQLKEALSRGDIRLLGPNCLGVIRPSKRLNASFATRNLRSTSAFSGP